MSAFSQYFTGIFHSIKNLWKGLMVTGRYFVSPKYIVTQQYPENRATLKMTERFKGEVIMVHDENNFHRCNACGICEMNCPNGTIEIISDKIINEEGKQERIIDRHIYHLSMCTFCGLCVKTCPSGALAFSQEFEHAVYNRQKLTKILNNPGSRIKREPRIPKEKIGDPVTSPSVN